MLGLTCAGGGLLLVAYMTHFTNEALALGTLVTGSVVGCSTLLYVVTPVGSLLGSGPAATAGGCNCNICFWSVFLSLATLATAPTLAPHMPNQYFLPPSTAGHMSFSEVVRELVGKKGSLLLLLSLVCRCAGLMIIYVSVAAVAVASIAQHRCCCFCVRIKALSAASPAAAAQCVTFQLLVQL